jgi:type VI protein secretion system component VasK
MPIAVAILSFIGAAIIFVIWKLIGSQENYETSYRCIAYLMALMPITAILSVIPYAGGIINMAIFIYYIVIASTQVHNIPSQKAWLVFGIIGIVLALFILRGEYTARNVSSQAEQWKKTSQEMQKQAEEMARQYKRQAEQNK